MGNAVSGLASGFDWSSFIDKMMSISQVPQNQLVTKKNLLSTKSSALASVKNLFADLQNSATALLSPSLFQQRAATLSNTSSNWAATASASTLPGDYTFNVTQLATTAKVQGATGIAQPIVPDPATPDDVVISSLNLSQAVTAGKFTINGVQISVATTDTLGDVFARISAQTGVTATYDSLQDKVTLSGGGALSLGAANDTSNFLQALKLSGSGGASVSSSGALGVVRTNVSLGSACLNTAITAVNGSGAGSFTINGVQIAYNVNTDTVQGVLGRINASTAGVTATYDPVQGRFSLTNKTTGDLGISVSEAAGGFLSALGLTAGAGATTVAGKDAIFTVNGGNTLTSHGNTFDASTHGVTGLTVTARGTGANTVTVGADASSARSAIDAFVKKYNTLQSMVDSITKFPADGKTPSTSTLAGDRDLRDMARTLRTALFDDAGNTGAVKRLADLGIDFSGTSLTLTVKDSAALDKALSEKADDVAAYFANATNGLGKRLSDILGKQLGDKGPFAAKTNAIDDQSTRIDKQISDWDRKLAAQRSAMEASFLQMENLQSIYQKQASAIDSMFNANKKSN
jgi:flagellar hook-associated protein 2